MRKTLNIVMLICALVAVGSIWGHNYFFVRYAQAGCPAPTPPACNVEVNNHGAISYISDEQSRALKALMGGFVTSALIATGLLMYSHNSQRKKP